MKKAHDSDAQKPVPTASDLWLCPACQEAYGDANAAAECCDPEAGWMMDRRPGEPAKVKGAKR